MSQLAMWLQVEVRGDECHKNFHKLEQFGDNYLFKCIGCGKHYFLTVNVVPHIPKNVDALRDLSHND